MRRYSVNRFTVYHTLLIIFSILVCLSLAVLLNRLPESEPFHNSESSMTEGWQISSGNMETWEAVSLPADVALYKSSSA